MEFIYDIEQKLGFTKSKTSNADNPELSKIAAKLGLNFIHVSQQFSNVLWALKPNSDDKEKTILVVEKDRVYPF